MKNIKWIVLAILCAAACTAPVGYTQGTPEDHQTMARPTVLPSWATNPNYAGGINIGTPTKIAPSAGRVADGWRNTEVPPAQEQNYEMGLLGDWVNWFDSGNTIPFPDLAGITSAVAGSKVFVSEVGWYEYGSGVSFTADGVNVVTATGMGVGQWVHQSVVFDVLSSLVLPSDLDNRTITSRAFVKGFGWYYYRNPPGGAVTSEWVRPATAIGAGEWVHELIDLIETVQIPVIGPAPHDAVIYPVGTAPGRLNRSIVDHGYFAHQISPIPNAYTLLLTTAVPTPQLTVPTIPQCKLNDVVRFSVNASVRSNVGVATQCQVWTEVSEDNGSTWTAVTSGNTLFMIVPASGATQMVGLGFSRTFAALTGALEVRIVASSDGVNQIGLSIDSYELWVTRP